MVDSLIALIKHLEIVHKQTRALNTGWELNTTRVSLLEELGKKSSFMLSQKLFHEQGNKCGRFLASLVQTKRATATVRHM